MTFDVPADAYARFMGRYSSPLARGLADFVVVRAGRLVLDVGCGAGALTEVLVERVGVESVSAVDPSESLRTAVVERFPGMDVRSASAESLPYADGEFDRTLAQLVVHFMVDPVAGLAEMARVTRTGGVVGANVWDHSAGEGPLSTFWRAAREIDPEVHDESDLAGVAEGHLVQLFESAGMKGPDSTKLSVRVAHPSFDEWWGPFMFGIGPAGEYVAQLSATDQVELREACRRLLPPAPFTVEASAWTVRWTKF